MEGLPPVSGPHKRLKGVPAERGFPPLDEVFQQTDYVTDGTDELRRIGNISNLFEDMSGGGADVETPFTLGMMGPGGKRTPVELVNQAKARGQSVEAAEKGDGLIRNPPSEGQRRPQYQLDI